jgi:hypothetical protein
VWLGGKIIIFIDRPICGALLVIVFALFLAPVYKIACVTALQMHLKAHGIIEETYYVIKTISFTILHT